MKYNKIIAIGVGFVTSITTLLSCSSENAEGIIFSSELIKITDASVELTKDAGSQQVFVDANCDWTVSVENGWSDLVVQKSSNQSVNVQTGENFTRDIRTANLMITSKGGVRKSLPIHQAIGDVSIRTNSELINYGEDGGQSSFQILSNTTWEIIITYPSDDRDWLSADKPESSGDQLVTLTAQKAITDIERNAVVTIKCTESGVTKNVQLNVNQSGLSQIYLTVVQDKLDFGTIDGDAKEVEISKSNAQWWITPVSIDPANDQSWFTISEKTGVGETKISVSCTDNTTPSRRLATLIFTSGNKNGGVTQQVMIEQEAGKVADISDFTAVSVENILKTISFKFGFSSQFAVTEYGVCYSATNSQPTISDGHTAVESSEKSATDVSVTVNDLQPRTTYYARAYAKNAVGTAYSSNVITFTTLGESPDKDDNPPLFSRKRNQ